MTSKCLPNSKIALWLRKSRIGDSDIEIGLGRKTNVAASGIADNKIQVWPPPPQSSSKVQKEHFHLCLSFGGASLLVQLDFNKMIKISNEHYLYEYKLLA